MTQEKNLNSKCGFGSCQQRFAVKMPLVNHMRAEHTPAKLDRPSQLPKLMSINQAKASIKQELKRTKKRKR